MHLMKSCMPMFCREHLFPSLGSFFIQLKRSRDEACGASCYTSLMKPCMPMPCRADLRPIPIFFCKKRLLSNPSPLYKPIIHGQEQAIVVLDFAEVYFPRRMKWPALLLSANRDRVQREGFRNANGT